MCAKKVSLFSLIFFIGSLATAKGLESFAVDGSLYSSPTSADPILDSSVAMKVQILIYEMSASNNASLNPVYGFSRARNTISSPTAVQSGDRLGAVLSKRNSPHRARTSFHF